MAIPSGQTLRHVGGWSAAFAWRERAAAYDDHLASVRREAYERAIEEEAARQAREVEKTRGRYNELMTLGYERAAGVAGGRQRSDLRAQDVLEDHAAAHGCLKAFGVEEKPRNEDDWTEEDDEFVETILKEMEAEDAADEPVEGEDDSEDVDGDHG